MNSSVAIAPSRRRWFLSGRVRDDEPTRQFCVDVSPFEVGRRAGLPLCLPFPTVSNVHAVLLMDQGRLVVKDLDSTNGTFVNGIRVQGDCEVSDGDLLQFAEVVFRVGANAKLAETQTIQGDVGDRALALIQFDRLIEDRDVVPFFQPIISLRQDKRVGFEVLARSRLYGLTEPKTMFQAAAILDMEEELSRIFREEGTKIGSQLPGAPLLFLNTHPKELEDDETLVFSMRELREAFPHQPLVLEIHEASVMSPAQMRSIKAALAALDIRLAYDDFGAGQTRLAELIEVPPDYLKFDLKFMRDIEQASGQRHKMLQDFVRMVRDVGIVALAEGVETAAADKICRDVGFDLGQGFFYGRPAVAEKFASRRGADDTDPTP
jgi:EAL domain-containing protein (putative c-di-GMP-specific phosphodiesterase class I)